MKKITVFIIGLFTLLIAANVFAGEPPVAPKGVNTIYIHAPNTSIYTSFQHNKVDWAYVYDDGDVQPGSNPWCPGNGTAYFEGQLPKSGTLYIHVDDQVSGWHIVGGEQVIPFINDDQINVEFTWVRDNTNPPPWEPDIHE